MFGLSRSFLLRMRNVSDKLCRENPNDVLCSVICFRKSRRVVYKNTVERGTTEMTIWRMRVACSLPKAANTHSQYVVLTAFPLQQWLHEHASVLRYTYIACVTCLPARGADWRASYVALQSVGKGLPICVL
jgi:hypothetical protein